MFNSLSSKSFQSWLYVTPSLILSSPINLPVPSPDFSSILFPQSAEPRKIESVVSRISYQSSSIRINWSLIITFFPLSQSSYTYTYLEKDLFCTNLHFRLLGCNSIQFLNYDFYDPYYNLISLLYGDHKVVVLIVTALPMRRP